MALAAGKGTRLFPLTGEIPKPMAPVVDTPIIEHIFDLLATHGIEEVHVNVHYLADALLEAYGEEPRALDYIPADTFFDFARDVFPRFLHRGERFVGYQGDFYWSDIGTLEAYRQAQYDVLSGKVRVRIPGEKRGETLWVGKNAQIHPSAVL